jgi:hypothetical protein
LTFSSNETRISTTKFSNSALTPNPAPRFLYLRFLLIYLNAKRKGNLPWIAEVECSTPNLINLFSPLPGPYLRCSVLVTFARLGWDAEIPESVMKGMTFADAQGCPKRIEEEEE